MKIRALLLGITVVLTSQVVAQTGPGGVGSSTTNQLWLMANSGVYTDAGVTPAANTNNVQQWNDQSGNTKNAIQLTLGNKPNYQTGVMNGFPVIRFTAANTDRILSAAVTAGNAASIWVAASYSSLPSPNPGLVHGAPSGLGFSGTGTDKVIGMWVATGTGRAWGRGVQSNSTVANLNNATGFVTTTGRTHLYLNQYNGTNTISQFVSGAVSSSVAYDGTLRSWTDFGIGNQGGETWNGDIAEVIVYNTFVNSAQRIIIDNYLAAKYGLTGASNITNDIYTMDDNANGDFDYDVAGIGRFNVSNTHTDSRGTGFLEILNPTDLATDGEYFFWGHNNLAAQANNTTDIPPGVGITGRFDRIWRVSEAGEVGNIDLQFDVTGLPDFAGLSVCDASTAIRLLVDTNNDGLFADQTPISGATNIGGNVYRFANVGAINNGYRFTLAIVSSSVGGPGGVGGNNGTTNLKLWLDANTGVSTSGANVTSWADQSGNSITCTSPAAGNRPTYTTNVLNGRPILTFSGASKYLELSANVNTTTPTTFIVGNKASAGVGYMTLLALQQNRWLVQGSALDQWGMFNNLDVLSGVTLNTTYRIMTTLERNFNDVDFYTDETFINKVTGTAYAGKALGTVGASNTGSTNTGLEFFNGNLAEIAVFNKVLNSAQRIIVENYLAAKYGLTLTANDVYTRDNPANGDFDYEMAGIGRVNSSNLHDDAKGTGIVRISNPTSLGDGDYLLWGHNNGTLIATTTDVPATVQARFNRVWSVSEVGEVGNIDMQFDLTSQSPVTASDLRLIIDNDGDGIFNEGTTIIISGAVALSCNNYQFSGVPAASLNNAMRFTIGTINKIQTPLPIVLSSFTGIMNNGAAELRWTTASEHNNDHFEIERSENGEVFVSLRSMPGAGQSTATINYSTIDEFPPLGKLYYRLKQVDFDKNFTYSKIVALTNNFSETRIQVSPNPVKIGDDLNIRVLYSDNITGEDINFVLFDMLGRSLPVSHESKGNNNFSIKTSSAKAAGMYILKMRTSTFNKDFVQRVYLID